MLPSGAGGSDMSSPFVGLLLVWSEVDFVSASLLEDAGGRLMTKFVLDLLPTSEGTEVGTSVGRRM